MNDCPSTRVQNSGPFFGKLHASFFALGWLCRGFAACCCSGTKSYDKMPFSHYSSIKMLTTN